MSAEVVPIAVLGLSCRTPGAVEVDAFWRLVRDGEHAVRRHDRDSLLAAGLAPEEVDHPDFVPVAGYLDDSECFDAAFFGISPAEAALLDPQIRVGLECAHAAFDDAAIVPGPHLGRCGIFVGASLGTYLLARLARDPEVLARHGGLRLLIASDRDHLAGQIAYRLDLRGPAVAVGAACATSLVAVDLACRRLAEDDVEVALAGGVAIHFPQARGYRHELGGIYSRDGRCRAYDAHADGVTPGAGAAMVLLKRLDRARADGDPIRAVILGSAVSGDGADKVGYSAPSEAGQAAAIAEAWRRAGVDPRTAGLIEGHGTATPLGDAVEIAALRRALPGARCALGSVKSNIGHLDVAAGAISLVKAVRALEVGLIPPTLHVEIPSPALADARGGFTLPTFALPWPPETPRVAGVSSFGIGGTNAHVVLAAAPEELPPPEPDGPAMVALGAADDAALARLAARLAEALDGEAPPRLRDLALSLAARSARFPMRRIAFLRDREAARAWLAAVAAGASATDDPAPEGGQDAAAARGFLAKGDGGPLASLLEEAGARRVSLPPYPFARVPHVAPAPRDAAGESATGGDVGAALSRLLEIGLAARAAAPVRTIDRRSGLATALDRLCGALALKALRALGGIADDGGIASARAIAAHAGADPRMTPLIEALRAMVVADATVPTEATSQQAVAQAVRAVDPAFAPLADLLVRCAARVPDAVARAEDGAAALYDEDGARVLAETFARLPPHRETSVAAETLATALGALARERAEPLRVLEIGAGAGGLTEALLRRLPECHARIVVTDVSRLFVAHLEARFGAHPNVAYRPLDVTRELAMQGFEPSGFDVVVGLDALHAAADIDRALETIRGLLAPSGAFVALETIRPSRWDTLIWGLTSAWWTAPADVSGPLRGLKGWREAVERAGAGLKTVLARPVSMEEGSDVGIFVLTPASPTRPAIGDWLYAPAWARASAPGAARADDPRPLVLLADAAEPASALTARIAEAETPALICIARDAPSGPVFEGPRVRPDAAEDIEAALRAAGLAGRAIRILHLWSLDGTANPDRAARRRRGFDSLVALAKALAGAEIAPGSVVGVLSDGICDVTGAERLEPAASLIDAPVQLLPRELPGVEAFRLDCDSVELQTDAGRAAAASLARDLLASERVHPLLALRGTRLWRETMEARPSAAAADVGALLTPGSTLLVVGGLGAMGATLAGALAHAADLHVVLSGRSAPRAAPNDVAALDTLVAEGALSSEARDRAAALLATGARVSLAPLDIADKAALAILATACAREGRPIRAVVHAAGTPDLGGVMIRRARTDTDAALRAKVDGLAALETVFKDRPLDLLVLCASIGSLLPNLKFGEVGYLAANTHLVASARAFARRHCGRILAISWTDWREGGMWHEAQARLQRAYRAEENNWAAMPDILGAIAPEDGREAFFRALALPDAEHVVICAQPLPRLLARHARFTADDHAAFLESRGFRRRASGGDQEPSLDEVGEGTQAADALERRLAALWRELLGLDHVGLDDDFFALGGDSLLGIRILNRLRVEHSVSDTLAGLMTAPTVRALAARVRRLASKGGGDESSSGFEEIRL